MSSAPNWTVEPYCENGLLVGYRAVHICPLGSRVECTPYCGDEDAPETFEAAYKAAQQHADFLNEENRDV